MPAWVGVEFAVPVPADRQADPNGLTLAEIEAVGGLTELPTRTPEGQPTLGHSFYVDFVDDDGLPVDPAGRVTIKNWLLDAATLLPNGTAHWTYIDPIKVEARQMHPLALAGRSGKLFSQVLQVPTGAGNTTQLQIRFKTI